MIGFGHRMPLRCCYGVVTQTGKRKFRSTCAHDPGMSGSAVYVDGEIVGVHTGYNKVTDEAIHTHIGAVLSDMLLKLSREREGETRESSGGADDQVSSEACDAGEEE